MSPLSVSSRPPSTLAASIDRQRALRHYERAIAALQGEPYRGIPAALRADLLERLHRERHALLQKMPHDEHPAVPDTVRTAPPPPAGTTLQ